jgi:hypothetical protein
MTDLIRVAQHAPRSDTPDQLDERTPCAIGLTRGVLPAIRLRSPRHG